MSNVGAGLVEAAAAPREARTLPVHAHSISRSLTAPETSCTLVRPVIEIMQRAPLIGSRALTGSRGWPSTGTVLTCPFA